MLSTVNEDVWLQTMEVIEQFARGTARHRGNALKQPFDEILIVALATLLSGGETYVDMADFGDAKLELLRELRPFENGTPSHDTFGRVFAGLDPDAFAQWFTEYTQSLRKRLPEIISLDGKTLRGSFDAASERSPIHMVNAWASRNRLILGQMPVADDSNEIPALRALLRILDVKDATVTADSMHCQRDTAKQILEQGGDYALAVKGNQESLFEDLKEFWGERGEVPGCSFHRTIECGHGRVETRTVRVSDRVEWIQEAHRWPGLEAVARVDSERQRKVPGAAKPRSARQTHYYLLSRNHSAAEAAEIIRTHWEVENKVHWVLDVVFDEDRSRIRADNGPTNMSLMRKLATNTLRREPSALSIKRKRLRAARDDRFLVNLLRFT